MPTKEVPCKPCRGAGSVPVYGNRPDIPCKNCRGRGKILVNIRAPKVKK